MKRNIGLDLVRTVAIMMVIVSHSRHIFHLNSPILGDGLWRLTLFGYYGVELFFVLSGFLIGEIIIKSLVMENESNNNRNILNFYFRRWFRTLPLYFVILICNIWFWQFISTLGYGYFGEQRYISWLHFIFLQNYNQLASNFFPESWSLAVEEWFYLVFPLVIMVFRGAFKNEIKVSFLKFLIYFILTILVIRIGYVINYDPSFDYGVRKNIFLRLDSLAIGVLFAHLSIYYKNFYNKLSNFYCCTGSIIGLFIISCFYWFYNVDGWSESIFARTIMLDMVSLFFAIIMIWCYKINSFNISISNILMLTSKLTYSIYLIHLPFFLVATYYTKDVQSFSYKLLIFLSVFILVYFLSYIIYKYYEKPFMDLRDKIPTFQNTKGV